eukprot:scaffold391347_cov16-Prasinocladus_malaysianus.AAC.1
MIDGDDHHGRGGGDDGNDVDGDQGGDSWPNKITYDDHDSLATMKTKRIFPNGVKGNQTMERRILAVMVGIIHMVWTSTAWKEPG